MAANMSLGERIKAEFEAREQRKKAEQTDRAKREQEREKRLEKFTKVCDDLKEVWRPRLDEFAKQFGDKIKVQPTITPSMREAKVVFLSDLATVTLTLSVSANPDVTKLVFDYDLLILPVFFDYERHARLETPLDKIDRDAIGKWVEDQLVSCVKAYLTIQDNEHYQKRSTVEDPVTKKRFMRGEAVATLEHKGQRYFFNTQESLREFKQTHGVKP